VTGAERAARAAEVLRRNDRGGSTIPSPTLYPHQWAWDSGFAAIGWARIDVDRAVAELESLLAGQWDDGRVPHIVFDPAATDYFPGPAFWGRAGAAVPTSTITNPPIWVIALARLAAAGADPARLAPLIDGSRRSLEFFATQRDPSATGAVAVVHPWESGRDNCPAWDAPMEAIDPDSAPPFERVDLANVGDPSQRPTDTEYRRYAALVAAIAADDFGPGDFAVYDPMMTALVLWAELELAALTGEPSPRESSLRAGLDALWDEAAGCYGFRDARGDRRYAAAVLAGYLPLIVERPGPRREALLAGLDRFAGAAHRWATTAPGSSVFESRRYWRGPVWINTNWLLAQVPELRAAAAAEIAALIDAAGFREYYDPMTGEGLGARDFTWSAALALDLFGAE
jgi:hypothetical protein